jgi:hypothetical protein
MPITNPWVDQHAGEKVSGMTAQPEAPDPGEPPAEVIESAEMESALAEHRGSVAAGRPGAVSHEQAMAELLAES